MKTKSLIPVLLVPSGILLIPAAAMILEFEGWAWSTADFVIFWVVIAGTVLAYHLLASRATGTAYRVAAAVGVTAGLLLVWINGAVGLIGSEENPANLMYGGVLGVGVIGAVLARLEPVGMSRALFATALVQFMVPVIALVVHGADFTPGVAQVFTLNSFFVLLFIVSGLLFRQAGIPSGGSGVQSTT
jgi:hypothetical protein